MNQCDIEKYNQPESKHSASLDYELLALVQVGASGEQVACGGQGDSHHPSAPNHVRMARGGVPRTGGILDTPNSWRGGNVGVRYLHLEEDG